MNKVGDMIKITDKKSFLHGVKQEVIKTFVIVFSDSTQFLNAYDESILSQEVLEFWLNHHAICKTSGGEYYILVKERERLRICLYKELCEGVLNKLVDAGILQMLWNNKKKMIYWKEIETVKNAQTYK